MSDGKLKAGDVVLVLGTGGVSIFALQIARSMGAIVIATSSSDAKLERRSAMGAAHTINYKSQPNWGHAATDWMDGQGVDHVIKVGGAATLPQSISAIRVGGRISLIGALTGRSGELPTVSLIVKNVCLQGVTVGSRSDQNGLIAGLETTGVKPVIDRSFPLGKLAQVFQYQIEGHHFGKIVIEF